jgi:hypothetical protein
MPNGVKYSTTTPSGSLRKGNVALGVTGDLGPTSITGFYSMPTPVDGNYIINKTNVSSLPNFFAPQNENELIRFAKQEGATGANTGSSTAVLTWIATQPNLMAANFEYENIVTDGLVLNLDAGFVGSYPINPSQVNLLYNNGVYTSGNGVSGFGDLGLWVTQSVIIPNNKFRISTGTVFRAGTEQSLRFYVPLSVLTNYQSYNLSFNYQIISGSLFSMDDWNDTLLSNNVNINYGSYQYSASTGTSTGATPAGTYNSTYRFMDFNFGTGSIVDIWDIQLTQNVSASLFNTGSGTTIYDLSGNNNNGTLINGPTFNSANSGSIVFDGTDDRLTFGSPNMTSSCTINQWIQPLSGSATTMGTITYVAVNSATSVLFSQLIKSAGTWYHQVLVSGYQSGYAEEMNMYFQSIVTSFVENNTPYNFTFTWERTPGVNSTLKTYLNGVYREQQINTNNYWANTASLATATYNISNTYKGNIGTTSFYNRALSAAEVLQNFNAQKSRFGF